MNPSKLLEIVAELQKRVAELETTASNLHGKAADSETTALNLQKRTADLEMAASNLQASTRRIDDFQTRIQGLEKHKAAIYGSIATAGALGLAGLFGGLFFQTAKLEAADAAAKKANDAAERAQAAASETNINVHAHSALSALLPECLEEQQGYQILLPANRLWLNTGIRISPNDTIKVRLSGGVNTAISELVLHDIEQTPIPYPWKHFPDDNIFDTRLENRRSPELVGTNAWYRDVLMFLATDQDEVSRIESRPNEVPQDRIIKVIPTDAEPHPWAGCEFEYTAPSAGILCFIVNDQYPTDVDHYRYGESQVAQYVRNMAAVSEFLTNGVAGSDEPQFGAVDVARWALRFHFSPPRSANDFSNWEASTWQKLATETDNRVFYDDNIGDYLLQIRIIRAVK